MLTFSSGVTHFQSPAFVRLLYFCFRLQGMGAPQACIYRGGFNAVHRDHGHQYGHLLLYHDFRTSWRRTRGEPFMDVFFLCMLLLNLFVAVRSAFELFVLLTLLGQARE